VDHAQKLISSSEA